MGNGWVYNEMKDPA